LHATAGPALDAIWGDGAIWSRALLDRYHPIRFDARPEVQPDVVGDWNHLEEHFALASVATVAWDPPHITQTGAGLVGAAKWANRYGTRCAGLDGNNVCGLFEPLLTSVRQILDPRRGTLIVKLADQVHSDVLQWQPFELRRVALELGWLACDYQVRIGPSRSTPNGRSSATSAAASLSGWRSTQARAVLTLASIWYACVPAQPMVTCSGRADATSSPAAIAADNAGDG
jgi:hypothetical protein